MAGWNDTDWFRSSRWSPEIAREFERRLARARSWNRPQYLRIQGLHLTRQDDPALKAQGRALLRRVVDEYGADEPLQAMTALEDLGTAYVEVGMIDEAAERYRGAIARQRTLSTGRSGSSGITEVLLAEILLDRGRPEDRAEVQALLAAIDDGTDWRSQLPSDSFRYLVARARLSVQLGLPDAAVFAHAALAVADQSSPFPRHPGVGVPAGSPALIAELRQIADA